MKDFRIILSCFSTFLCSTLAGAQHSLGSAQRLYDHAMRAQARALSEKALIKTRYKKALGLTTELDVLRHEYIHEGRAHPKVSPLYRAKKRRRIVARELKRAQSLWHYRLITEETYKRTQNRYHRACTLLARIQKPSQTKEKS